MASPTDPVRERIEQLVESAQVVGSPALKLWDRRGPLTAQAFRRFWVEIDGGNLSDLNLAPAIGAGGVSHLERTYSVAIIWEQSTSHGKLSADAALMLDDLEQIASSIVRGSWQSATTGIEILKPGPWRTEELPSGALAARLTIDARVRREI